MYKCKKHPKYKVMRQPRCLCEACWWLWMVNNYVVGTRMSAFPMGLKWVGKPLDLKTNGVVHC